MDEEQFLSLASEPCILGVDPGASNTGWVVIHEESGTVLHSSTIKRSPADMKPFTWASLCVSTTDEAVAKFNITKVAVEGVEEPNVYHNGKKNMLRPLFLINTAIVAGAYALHWEKLKPVIVRPSKNGSGDKDGYPPELVGRRPKWLDGIRLTTTRRHELSSYDVAVKGLLRYREGYLYDHREGDLKGEPAIANPKEKGEASPAKKAKKIAKTSSPKSKSGLVAPKTDLLSKAKKIK